MTDYVITSGRSPVYPVRHYGSHFTGTRATFFEPADFATLDANALAIPKLPITVLSAAPVTANANFFGVHINKRANDNTAEIQFGTVRSISMEGNKGTWFGIQTGASTFDWSGLDSWVNYHYSMGRDLLINLFGTPTFLSARPTEASITYPGVPGALSEPADMTKWAAFCTAVATRYLGKVKHYEVWNEPNLNADGLGGFDVGEVYFFSGTFAKLSEMTRIANQAIKAVDPTAKIVSSPVTEWGITAGGQAENYFTSMMTASTGDGSTTMKDWIDIVGVHLYSGGNIINNLPKMIDRINAAKTTAGVSGKETWDTESSPIAPAINAMTAASAQRFIGRSMITQAAKGISRSIFYMYDSSVYGFKDTAISDYRNNIRQLLLSGEIGTACMFDDGRIACHLGNKGLLFI